MTKDDVVRIIEQTLSELRIVTENGSWTIPNDRIIKLMLGNQVISETTLSVVQRSEYGG
jgi:hypothetical protein